MSSSPAYVDIVRRKRESRAALIPPAWRLAELPSSSTLNVMDIPAKCGILSSKELEITENNDATALAAAVREKKYSAVEVCIAYCKRASIAQALTNCLTEILFDSAIKRAKFLDHHLKRHGTPVGPLHGVPVSIKDQFHVPGFDASVGYAVNCNKPSVDTSLLVKILINAGAVIYCKTNISQAMAALDSDNNVFGRVLNPQNRLLTAGGSSGGEGVLVAMKGSPLGIGSDIGGSIRIPAMCNGVYGVKPSAFRIPLGDAASGGGSPGSHSMGIVASAGPIARSLRDCELLLKTVADARPWNADPFLVPGDWSSSSFDLRANPSAPKLTIGILATDNLVTPLPPIASLIQQVSQILGASHAINLVHIPAPAILGRAQSLANKLMGLEGSNGMFDLLDATGEPLIPWLDGKMKRKAPATLAAFYALQAQKESMCAELARTLWKMPSGADVDAIVCPVAPHPTPKIDSWVGVGYTIDWVLADYPAGVLPVRKFEERDLDGEYSEPSLGAWDDNTRKLWPKEKQGRQHYVGSTLCVQVLAPRLQERRLIRCMEVVERALKESLGFKGVASKL